MKILLGMSEILFLKYLINNFKLIIQKELILK